MDDDTKHKPQIAVYSIHLLGEALRPIREKMMLNSSQAAKITALDHISIPRINAPIISDMRRIAEINTINNILVPTIISPVISALSSALRIGGAWREMMGPLHTFWAEWAEFEKAAEKLEAAGWLPHPTLPQDLLVTVNDMDETEVSLHVEAYYRDHWDEVEEQFRQNFQKSDLDDEAFSAVNEALMAHRHGLYRACCRTIFPEIERVARIRFYDGKGTTITSLREVRASILELPLSDITGHGHWARRVFQFIENQCYANFKVDDELDSLSLLPNRHAIAHGIIPYSSARDSLNSLVSADFMFRALNAIARNKD